MGIPTFQSPDVLKLRYETHRDRVVRCHRDRPGDIASMFAAAVARAHGEIAIVDGALRLSYLELDQLADLCARRMSGCGVVSGDRIGILLDNRADFLVIMLAAARLGAISTPMNIRQRAPEIAFVLKDCGAKLLFHEASVVGQLPRPEEVPELRTRLTIDDDHRAWDYGDAGAGDFLYAAAHEDAPFCILYTSGTTGRPKGAVLTHLGVVTSCLGARDALGLQDGESTVVAVPASHVTGVILDLLLLVLVAGKSVMQRGFNARRFLELAALERMSYAILVPAMYTLCLIDAAYDAFDLSAWRVGAFGGAPMPEATLEALARKNPGLRLVNIYGATETSSPAVLMPPDEAASYRAYVGRPLPYCDLLIVDEDGREVPAGDPGEIWISGPMVIPGYWNNPEATAEAFIGGYWRSGDIGSIDEHGFVRLLDRKKDMINRGGFKIYSAEVENTLMSHPAVVEAAVVGRPCPVLGERVEAFAVVSDQIDGRALRAFCAEQLSDYKVPDHVELVQGPLPRNANGKLLKSVMRGWLKDPTTT